MLSVLAHKKYKKNYLMASIVFLNRHKIIHVLMLLNSGIYGWI